jgi:lipid A 3-O-deacylase
MRWLFFISFVCLSIPGYPQAMDNTALYNALPGNSYLRVSYDNDFFSGEDRYYTQGINIEVANSAFNNFFIYKAFIRPKDWNKTSSIAVEHNAYTPTSIQSDTILKGNRPFAAVLSGKFSTINTDIVRKQRLSSSLSIGVIGSAAGGNEMQTSIHEATNNIIPKGWRHQVENDIVLNYQLSYDKNIYLIDQYLSLDAHANAQSGTLKTKAGIGIQLNVGHFNNGYSVIAESRKIGIQAYVMPQVYWVGYDATLQGGLFNKNSPYTISADQISRFIFESRYGIRLSYKKIHLSYFQSYRTKEFAGSGPLKFGGVQMAVLF